MIVYKIKNDYWASKLGVQTGIFSIIVALATSAAGVLVFRNVNYEIKKTDERTLEKINLIESQATSRIEKIEKNNADFQADNRTEFNKFKDDFENLEIQSIKSAKLAALLAVEQARGNIIYFIAQKFQLLRLDFILKNKQGIDINKEFLNPFKDICEIFHLKIKTDSALKQGFQNVYSSGILNSFNQFEKAQNLDFKYKCYELRKSMEEYLGINSDNSSNEEE